MVCVFVFVFVLCWFGLICFVLGGLGWFGSVRFCFFCFCLCVCLSVFLLVCVFVWVSFGWCGLVACLVVCVLVCLFAGVFLRMFVCVVFVLFGLLPTARVLFGRSVAWRGLVWFGVVWSGTCVLMCACVCVFRFVLCLFVLAWFGLACSVVRAVGCVGARAVACLFVWVALCEFCVVWFGLVVCVVSLRVCAFLAVCLAKCLFVWFCAGFGWLNLAWFGLVWFVCVFGCLVLA